MSDDGKPKSWWYTLPSIITTVTATVTALTGLVAAINQTGWFGALTTPAANKASASIPSAPPGPVSRVPPAQTPPLTTSPHLRLGRPMSSRFPDARPQAR